MTEIRSLHSGPRLMSGAAWNLAGQGVPLLIGIASLPILVRSLGTEAFGVFQLTWAVLAYFAFLDLGLGRATTKFVAEFVGSGRSELVRPAVASSLLFQGALGLLGGGLLAWMAPWLSERFFEVPTELVSEARLSFLALSAAVPVILLNASLGGTLQAFQRFDLVNWVQAANGAATYLFPVGVVWLGGGLASAVLVVVCARIASCATYATLVTRQLRAFPGDARFDRGLFATLLALGGWVSVSSLLSPIMTYLDRVLIGATMTVAAVAYYATPFDVVTRLSIVAASIIPPLFPAFSAFDGMGDREKVRRLFLRAAKLVALVTLPLSATVIVLARPGLAFWLGPDFAANSTTVTQVLAIAVLVNSMAQLPYALLQAVGRADLPAKFHAMELAVFPPVLWISLRLFGIEGAAAAWLFRVALDSVLLHSAASRLVAIPPFTLTRTVVRAILPPLGGFCLAMFTTLLLGEGWLWRLSGLGAALVLFGAIAWRYSLDGTERAQVRSLLPSRRVENES